MKKEVKTRSITGKKAVKYTELANKLVMLNLVSPEERKKYFDAVYALRELADEYCKLHGLELI
jgi:GTP-dependent phosphoenolpyruvate carboxykinase